MKKKSLIIFLSMVVLSTSICFGSIKNVNASLTNFVTRSVDTLYDGNNSFRFIGMNTPTLALIGDTNQTTGCDLRIADPYEIDDQIKSLAQMGVNAVRLYPLSIQGSSNDSRVNFIKRDSNYNLVYNETAFKTLDYVLKRLNDYGMRAIFPLVDGNNYTGGQNDFSQYICGKAASEFFANDTDGWIIRNKFYSYISYLLNRTNTYTGTQYKNDKTILCWENGNEISPTSEWRSNVSYNLKQMDSNHLVMDGTCLRTNGISSDALNDPNTDIVTNHYYTSNYSTQCSNDKNASKGRKAFIVGEFGIADSTNIGNLITEIYNDGTSGGLLWSLRGHSKDGGFLWHKEAEWTDSNGKNVQYWDYHLPGFPSGDAWYETTVLGQVRDYNAWIQGKTSPTLPIPEVPTALNGYNTNTIKWRGSAGGSNYEIQKATGEFGTFATTEAWAYDADLPYKPYNDDNACITDTPYYYTVKAKNSTGTSSASNVIGPIFKHNFVINPGFEYTKVTSGTNTSIDVSGSWYTSGTLNASFTENGGYNSTTRLAQYSSSGYQALTEQYIGSLSSGYYTLKAKIMSSGGQTDAHMYINSYGGSELQASMKSVTNTWTDITIPNVYISSGYCKIGFWSNANASNWIRVDDVRLFQ